MRMEFFSDGPGLVVEEDQRVLVIADPHFGIEADLAAHGLHVRSRSRQRLNRLLRTIEAANPDFLVLLGDVKHSIPTTTRQEFVEMPAILDSIRDKVPFRVLPGNHDPGLERFLRQEEVLQKDGAIIDHVGYLHGHTYPSRALAGHLIIAGHHHPMASIHDSVGCALQAPAYIRAEADTVALGLAGAQEDCPPTRVLLMPAFCEIAGYDILRIARDPFSPLSRCMDTARAEIILADGSYVGPLQSLVNDEGS